MKTIRVGLALPADLVASVDRVAPQYGVSRAGMCYLLLMHSVRILKNWPVTIGMDDMLSEAVKHYSFGVDDSDDASGVEKSLPGRMKW